MLEVWVTESKRLTNRRPLLARPCLALVTASWLTVLGPHVAGQSGLAWTPSRDIGPMGDLKLTYDPARRQLLAYGSQGRFPTHPEIWALDGIDWVQRHADPSNQPSGVFEFAVTFDQSRGRLIVVGGIGGAASRETHEWDGAAWHKTTTPSLPPLTGGHALGYDSTRQQVLLYAGRAAAQATYSWNGSTWTRLTPTTSPPALRRPIMIDAPSRRSTLLLGDSGTGTLQFYEWDGSNWTSRTGSAQPSGAEVAAAWDPGRNRLVVFNGETWEWDGTAWTKRNPVTTPQIGYRYSMAYHAGFRRIILHGGTKTATTWSWDGTDWQLLRSNTRPAPRSLPGMAHDPVRGRTVMFGGLDPSQMFPLYPAGTFEWDGRSWTRRQLPTEPAAREGLAMVYDSNRGRIVMFGGRDFSTTFQDTWEYRAGAWTKRSIAGPSQRWGHAMAYDGTRRKVVVFGGYNQSPLDDTWEFDGTTWTKRSPTNRPAPRQGHSMAFDPVRNRVVMFGGDRGSAQPARTFGDTWEWDGNNWRLLRPVTRPNPRANHSMAFDPGRGQIALYGGGSRLAARHRDSWVFNGTQWATIGASSPSFSSRNPALVFDGRARQLLRFGSRTHRLGIPARIESTGAGCGPGSGIPTLGSPLPHVSQNAFWLEMIGGRPHSACAITVSAGRQRRSIGPCVLWLRDPIVTYLASATNAYGFAVAPPLVLPPGAAFRGQSFHAQGFVLDPTTPLGVSATGGQKLTIGN